MNNQFPPGAAAAAPQPGEHVKEEASKLKETLTTEVAVTGDKLKAEAMSAVGSLKEAGRRYSTDQAVSVRRRMTNFDREFSGIDVPGAKIDDGISGIVGSIGEKSSAAGDAVTGALGHSEGQSG